MIYRGLVVSQESQHVSEVVVADRVIFLNRNRFLIVFPGLIVLFEGPIAASDVAVGLIKVWIVHSSTNI